MRESKNWSKNDIFLLIDLYKERPCLWDPANEEYNKRRVEEWKEIAKHFNLDWTIVHKKMKSICGSFRREKTKVQREGGTEWYAFEKMKFLLDKGAIRKKEKRRTFPNTARQLFIRLYFKRRTGVPKRKMIEAVKAWTMLSETEKEQFTNTYQTCQLNHKKKLANYLDKKTKPYLKKKNLQRPVKEVTTQDKNIATIINNEEDTEADVNNKEQEHPALLETSHNITENEPSSYFNNLNDTSENSMGPPELQSQRHSIDKHVDILTEPTPPNVRNAKELFNMINSMQGENLEWRSLSNAQKSHYHRAVASLKYNYILKYKAYLESLPSKELYDYYNNFF